MAYERLKEATPPKNPYVDKDRQFRFDVPFVTDWTMFVTQAEYMWKFSVLWNTFKPKSYLVIGALVGSSESYACWRTKHFPDLIVVADIDLSEYNPHQTNLASVYKNISKNFPHELIIMKTNSQTSTSLRKHGPYDLVFVDGEHSEKGVQRDMDHAFLTLKEGGVIMVHDVDDLSNVKDGYNAWVGRHKHEIDQLVIPSSGSPSFQMGLGLIQKKKIKL
jgi:predicted O-methyltransferase YrrM